MANYSLSGSFPDLLSDLLDDFLCSLLDSLSESLSVSLSDEIRSKSSLIFLCSLVFFISFFHSFNSVWGYKTFSLL